MNQRKIDSAKIDAVLSAVLAEQNASEQWTSTHLKVGAISLNLCPSERDQRHKCYSMHIQANKDSVRIYVIGSLTVNKVPTVTTALDANAINEVIKKMAADVEKSFVRRKFKGRLLR